MSKNKGDQQKRIRRTIIVTIITLIMSILYVFNPQIGAALVEHVVNHGLILSRFTDATQIQTF